MAGGEPPEKYALRIHLTEATDTVELNLQVIGNRLAEKNFITPRQKHDILGVLGQPSASKANCLMRCVESKIDTSHKREEWFEEFVLILANDTAADELVEKLTRDLGKFRFYMIIMPQITKFTLIDTVKKKPQYKGCLLKYITNSQGQYSALGVVPSGVNQYVIQTFQYFCIPL